MAESRINTAEFNTDPREILPDDQMGALVDVRWRAAKNHRSGKEDQWDRWYSLYRSYAERKEWPNSTSLFIPLIWSTVESFLPRIVTERPKIEVAPREDNDHPTAKYHRRMLEYQWDHLSMPTVVMNWVKEAMIYGTAILKTGWERVEKEMMFRETVGGEPVSQTTVVKNEPVAKLVPLEDFYPAPGASDVQDAAYCIHRHKMTWWELDELADAGYYKREAVNSLRKFAESGSAEDTEGDRHKVHKATTFGEQDPEASKKQAEIHEFEVIEYWEDDRVAVIVPDVGEAPVVLANQENPHWHKEKPFIRIVDNPLPNEFYGVGEPEVLESINMELNEIHNFRMENVKRQTMQMFKVRIGSPVTPNMLKFKPQGVVWVTDQDDVQPLFSGNSGQVASHREEDLLRLWSQQTSGATDPFQGLETDIGSETATGASILAQAAASRVGLKFLVLSEMGLRPLARQLISLNEQNIEEPQAVRILGPAGQDHELIGPEELATGGSIFDVRVDVAATDPINRELQLQKNINFLGIMNQLFGDPTHPAIQVLLERIMDLADIDIDPKILAQPPNPQAAQASQGEVPEEPPGSGSGTPQAVNPEGQIAETLQTQAGS